MEERGGNEEREEREMLVGVFKELATALRRVAKEECSFESHIRSLLHSFATLLFPGLGVGGGQR
jgi:hypothetical protein